VEGKTSAEAELGAVAWLRRLFPFLDAKVTLGGELGASGAGARDKTSEIELRPIDAPQRQLVQLALHYFANLSDRTLVVVTCRAIVGPVES